MCPDKVALKVKEVMDEVRPGNRKEKMSIRRKVVDTMLKEEDSTVHTAIQEAILQMKEGRKQEGGSNAETGTNGMPSPMDYHKAIKKLPEFLHHTLKSAAASTGWVIFVAAAGPNPIADGSIYMEQYCFGPKSAAGQDFINAHSGYKEGFQTLFGKYVKNVFPLEKQQSYALMLRGPQLNPIDETPLPSLSNDDETSIQPSRPTTPATMPTAPEMTMPHISSSAAPQVSSATDTSDPTPSNSQHSPDLNLDPDRSSGSLDWMREELTHEMTSLSWEGSVGYLEYRCWNAGLQIRDQSDSRVISQQDTPHPTYERLLRKDMGMVSTLGNTANTATRLRLLGSVTGFS
ncbi:hypothetical protein BD779DRAFT_1477016 [Infundibulicybe gibba]|nr:hypothetical protein BD779DRAFT_1477016 [Infundibulicybe gibba]